MKVGSLQLFTYVLALSSSVSGLSCQEALSIVDDASESVKVDAKTVAASKLLTGTCRGFMMGRKRGTNPVAYYKANIAHVASRLNQIDVKAEDLQDNLILDQLFQTILNLIPAQIEAGDVTTLSFLEQLTGRVHDQASGQLSSEVPLLEEQEGFMEQSEPRGRPFEGALMPELLRIFRAVSGLRSAEFKVAQEYKELSGDIGLLGTIEGANVEKAEEQDPTIQLYGGLVDQFHAEAIIDSEMEFVQDRKANLDKGLTASKLTIRLQDGKESYYIDCASLLASDFLLGKVKISDLQTQCFHAMDDESVFQTIFFSPTALNLLSDDIWKTMSEERLEFLVSNEVLTEVHASKLNLIGTGDPEVCNIFADPEVLKKIPNMKKLNPQCVAASYSWGLLVQHMGKEGGPDMLAGLTSQHFTLPEDELGQMVVEVNLGALANSELSPQQWRNLGKNDPTFCEGLPGEMLGMLPGLAANLSPECIKARPELITYLDEGQRSKYVKPIREAIAQQGQVSNEVLGVLLSLDSESETAKLFEQNPALCIAYGELVSEVSVPTFGRFLKVCPGAGLRTIRDDQLDVLLKDCKSVTVDDIISIGTTRFFAHLDNRPTCVREFQKDVLSLLTMEEDALVTNLPSLKPEQLGSIDGEVIEKHATLLTPSQRTSIAEPSSPAHHHSSYIAVEAA